MTQQHIPQIRLDLFYDSNGFSWAVEANDVDEDGENQDMSPYEIIDYDDEMFKDLDKNQAYEAWGVRVGSGLKVRIVEIGEAI